MFCLHEFSAFTLYSEWTFFPSPFHLIRISYFSLYTANDVISKKKNEMNINGNGTNAIKHSTFVRMLEIILFFCCSMFRAVRCKAVAVFYVCLESSVRHSDDMNEMLIVLSLSFSELLVSNFKLDTQKLSDSLDFLRQFSIKTFKDTKMEEFIPNMIRLLDQMTILLHYYQKISQVMRFWWCDCDAFTMNRIALFVYLVIIFTTHHLCLMCIFLRISFYSHSNWLYLVIFFVAMFLFVFVFFICSQNLSHVVTFSLCIFLFSHGNDWRHGFIHNRYQKMTPNWRLSCTKN